MQVLRRALTLVGVARTGPAGCGRPAGCSGPRSMFPLPPFTNPPGLLSLEVWLSAPGLAADLAAFLADTAYAPLRIAGHTISVRPPPDVDEDIARAELDI